jgi:hypothetical protein
MHVIEVASIFFVFAGLFLLKGVQCLGKFLFWFTIMQLKISIIVWSTNDLGTVLFSGYLMLQLLKRYTGFRTNPKAAACQLIHQDPIL